MLPDDRSPFDMLLQSHRRLRERLADLQGAADRLPDPDALAIIDDVLGFFARAVARHERDEEQSLFPRLAPLPELAPLMTALTEEHREKERLAEELDMALAARDERAIREMVSALIVAHTRHIDREEAELFPAAERALGPDVQAEMLREMQARRGR
jgi:hemerythrin-like domain-containing protein